jgi:hypothetical protein
VQGDLRSRAGAWYQSNFKSELEPNGRPVVTVDRHYTAGQAAQAIMSEATGGYFADSIGAHYKKYHLSRSKGVDEFRKWQKESVAEAGRQASILAEMYVSGIATLTPSGDPVVTLGELADGDPQWQHFFSILPLLEKLTTVLAVLVPIGNRFVKLPTGAANKLKRVTGKQLDRIKQIAKRAKSDHEASELVLKELGPPPATKHHIATDKNTVSALRGGPWTPRLKDLFDRAGLSLQHQKNIMEAVPWHSGPHSQEYNQEIYRRLVYATEGKKGDEFGRAILTELDHMAVEIRTPGTKLHDLLLY